MLCVEVEGIASVKIWWLLYRRWVSSLITWKWDSRGVSSVSQNASTGPCSTNESLLSEAGEIMHSASASWFMQRLRKSSIQACNHLWVKNSTTTRTKWCVAFEENNSYLRLARDIPRSWTGTIHGGVHGSAAMRPLLPGCGARFREGLQNVMKTRGSLQNTIEQRTTGHSSCTLGENTKVWHMLSVVVGMRNTREEVSILVRLRFYQGLSSLAEASKSWENKNDEIN